MSLPSFLPEDTRHLGTRGLIASVFSFFAFLGFWVVHAFAQVDDAMGAFYAPGPLVVVQYGLLAAMACALVLGIVSWRIRGTAEEPAWLTTAITVSAAPTFGDSGAMAPPVSRMSGATIAAMAAAGA